MGIMSPSSSSGSIGKKELEHLARLSRIELDPGEEEKLIKDLGNILDHFKELQELDTSNIAPMTGGTDLTNVFRADGKDDGGRESTNRGAGTEAFPESKDGYLKVPPVFE
jgi:aspartyl-tRNA(Asn)/glutamyl-tRNA(Gln) amidotransferase subunit C